MPDHPGGVSEWISAVRKRTTPRPGRLPPQVMADAVKVPSSFSRLEAVAEAGAHRNGTEGNEENEGVRPED